MIQGVIGALGSGKTTFLAMAVYEFQHGRTFLHINPKNKTILTNFECPGCYKLDFDTLGKYNYHDCIMLIDEIMLLADNRNFKSFPEHLKAFFTLSRRSGVDILWCSQTPNCDLKIRALTEEYYLLERSRFIPGVSFVKPIRHRLGVKGAKLDDDYELAAPVEWRVVFRPKYYHMFDSFESVLHQLPKPDLELWSVDTDTE